jgi:hypothetical protein
VSTLGALSIHELVSSAERETGALSDWVDRLPLDPTDALILHAYLGSIWSRLAVANMKLRDIPEVP